MDCARIANWCTAYAQIDGGWPQKLGGHDPIFTCEIGEQRTSRAYLFGDPVTRARVSSVVESKTRHLYLVDTADSQALVDYYYDPFRTGLHSDYLRGLIASRKASRPSIQ